jgi:hypothetical protein
VAKKKKNKKNKNRVGSLFGNGAAGAVATEIVGNALGQIVADAMERYLGPGGSKKKLKKRLRKLTSQQHS